MGLKYVRRAKYKRLNIQVEFESKLIINVIILPFKERQRNVLQDGRRDRERERERQKERDGGILITNGYEQNISDYLLAEMFLKNKVFRTFCRQNQPKIKKKNKKRSEM